MAKGFICVGNTISITARDCIGLSGKMLMEKSLMVITYTTLMAIVITTI